MSKNEKILKAYLEDKYHIKIKKINGLGYDCYVFLVLKTAGLLSTYWAISCPKLFLSLSDMSDYLKLYDTRDVMRY